MIESSGTVNSLPGLKCLDNVTRLRVVQLLNYKELLRGTEEDNRYHVFDASDHQLLIQRHHCLSD